MKRFFIGSDDNNVVDFFPIRKNLGFSKPVHRLGGFNSKIGKDSGRGKSDRFIKPKNIKKDNQVGHIKRDGKGANKVKNNCAPGNGSGHDFQKPVDFFIVF